MSTGVFMAGVRKFVTAQACTPLVKSIVHAIESHLASLHPYLAPVQPAPDGHFAIDLHTHTRYSFDSSTDPAALCQAAARRGLSGVAVTDHDTLDGAQATREQAARLIDAGALPPRFFVIIGAEISSADGHVLGLFLSEPVPRGMSAASTIAAIHAQGGLAIAAHPLMATGVGRYAQSLPFDGVETHGLHEQIAFTAQPDTIRALRGALYADIQAAPTGGSDSHLVDTLGFCHTLVPGAPTPEAVADALRTRRTGAASFLSLCENGRLLRRGITGRLLRVGYRYATCRECLAA